MANRYLIKIVCYAATVACIVEVEPMSSLDEQHAIS